MGEQFGQRYPNGTPLQTAATRLNAPTGFGPPKPSGLTNGQPYIGQNVQAPVPASFPHHAYSHPHYQQPVSHPATYQQPGPPQFTQPPPLGKP